ncbi:hypothetical protein RI367_003836 [Sorochytrium milnesiophthora]
MKLLTLLVLLAYLSLSAQGLTVNTTKIKDVLPLFNTTQILSQGRSLANKTDAKAKQIASFTYDTAKGKINVLLANNKTVAVPIPARPALPRKVTTSSNTSINAVTYEFAAGESDIKFVERFVVRTNPVPCFHGSFWLNNTATTDWFHFRTGLHKLIEFNDTVPVETSTRVVSLVNLNWTAWNTVQKLDDNGNATIFNLTSTVTPSPGFVVTVEAIMTANNSAVVYGTPMAPRMVKYNLRISNFPYTMAQSGLALVKTLVTRTVDSTLSADSFGALIVGSGNGRLSWAPTVSLGGSATANISLSTIASVTSSGIYNFPAESVLVDETAQALVYKVNAVQPHYIFWDPNVEMQQDQMQDDSAAIMSVDTSNNAANALSATPVSAFFLAVGVLVVNNL